MTWIRALRIHNSGGSWCVYKRGTPDYVAVEKIQGKLKKLEAVGMDPKNADRLVKGQQPVRGRRA